ncbi:sensor histidine kinase [Microvirga roseola]|uniref:sensor histidine kinase n=1 Tax=Microvirga roseola TaxID=2883126 RepID=UPI002AC33E02|nr:sensor histidine kinase [Microvirga roseola]
MRTVGFQQRRSDSACHSRASFPTLLPFPCGRPAGPAGLGLGLYIASEIARAHGGTLQVSSEPRETCFTFRMQLA